MAFGKDKDVLKSVGNFRQQGNFASPPRKKGKGGGGAFYSDRFKPSTVDPDHIRFVAGAYTLQRVFEIEGATLADVEPGTIARLSADGGTLLVQRSSVTPFFCHTEHFDGRMNLGCNCSAGPFGNYRDFRQPCLGCDIFWESMGKKGDRMSRRDMFDFSVFNYATFHKAPQVDNEGKVRTSPTTGKPYFEWTQCQGRNCNGCRAGLESKKGHMQYYSVGWGHYATLKEYSKIIGNSCNRCGGRNCIQSLAWLCRGCKDAVIDMASTTLTDPEIDKMTENPADCPLCGHRDYLDEYIECQGCIPRGLQPDRATLFDVDIDIKRVISNEDSNNNSLLITGYSDPRPVDPQFAEAAKPMDLVKIYTPTSLEDQSKKFKMPIPTAQKPASNAHLQTPQNLQAAQLAQAQANQLAMAQQATMQRQPVPVQQVAQAYQPPAAAGGGMFRR